MQVRKRTRTGKSQKQTVVRPLELVARRPDGSEITLVYETAYYDTQHSLTLTKTEARDLANSMLRAINEM